MKTPNESSVKSRTYPPLLKRLRNMPLSIPVIAIEPPPPYAGHQMRVSGRMERVSSSTRSYTST